MAEKRMEGWVIDVIYVLAGQGSRVNGLNGLNELSKHKIREIR
jgi:hypothetical protein